MRRYGQGRKRELKNGRLFVFYLPLELLEKLKERAEKENLSMATLIRRALEKELS